MEDDLEAELLELAGELFAFERPRCEHSGCDKPRGTGRRRFCDDHAGARVQASKNRWWRRHGTDWRNGAAA